MRFDLHVHTTISPCSQLDYQDILSQARVKGLDGVCITDHESMEIRRFIREGIQDDGLCVIFGMEYSTSDGDFLIFGPFENLPPGLSATDMLDAVRRADGAAVAAHPFRAGRAVAPFIFERGLCRIAERVNGRNTDVENRQVALCASLHSLGLCGGSDAHTLDELGTVATWFQDGITSRNDLVRALNKGRCEPIISEGDYLPETIAA